MAVSNEKIIILDSIGSTNNYAMGMIQKGAAAHGTAVFAIEQTAGKGRTKKVWETEPGANILLSVITDMNGVFLGDQFALSMIAALSVSELINRYSHVKAFVKWPNDVVVNDKKAAGILIENVIRGTNWQWAVTGFGVNLNQKQFGGYTSATSLSIETGEVYKVQDLAIELREIFLSKLHGWRGGKMKDLPEIYNRELYKRDALVRLQEGSRIFEARIQGVSSDGRLITQDAFERRWQLDEVKLRL